MSAEAVSGWRGRGRRGGGVARKEQGGEETFMVPKREMGVQENLARADQVEVATRGQDIISDGTSEAMDCVTDASVSRGNGWGISTVEEGQRVGRGKI